MTNIIMRPVFNRPEMLKLSLEYEIEARKKSGLVNDEFTTLFVVEHSAPEETLQLLRSYPYKKIGIKRSKKHGLSINILTGMQQAFEQTDTYVIYIEDDILIHSTYFEYMNKVMDMFKNEKVSVFASYTPVENNNINAVYKGHHYGALAPLITKYFFENYINPHIKPAYYTSFATRSKYVNELNMKYKDYWGKKYKYKNTAHNEQAGLINRLVDVALIEENMPMVLPRVDRQQHIGYFGKNRPGGIIPGNSFDERVKNLRNIITDANKMYTMSATKQYNDYRVFKPELNNWDGNLYVK